MKTMSISTSFSKSIESLKRFNKKERKLLILFLILFFLRAFFINYNYAEWGDSYRYLRAGEFLLQGSYPKDEKRLPLYPLFLAPGNFFSDPVLYARMLNFVLFSLTLVLVFFLARKIMESFGLSVLCVLLLFFNPVFFYWSLRVMAVNMLAFIAVLAALIFLRFQKDSGKKAVLLGFLSALGFLTRYEGFFLFLSIFLIYLFRREIKNLFLFSLSSLAVVSPWLYRNYLLTSSFFKSSYFSEPAEFSYTKKEFLTWVGLALFLFASPHIWSALKRKNLGKLDPLLIMYPFFVFAVSFLWPAAVPRLFVSAIPLVSVAIVFLVFRSDFKKREVFLGAFFILSFFAIRMSYRDPFMLFGKDLLAVVLILNFISLLHLALNGKPFKYAFFFLVISSQVVVLASVLKLHRNVGKTVKEASLYVSGKGGEAVYSDETGVTSYYLKRGAGIKYDLGLSDNEQYLWVLNTQATYIIDTNEHNEGESLSFFKDEKYRDLVEEVKVFKSNIGQTGIWSKVYRVKEKQ